MTAYSNSCTHTHFYAHSDSVGGMAAGADSLLQFDHIIQLPGRVNAIKCI